MPPRRQRQQLTPSRRPPPQMWSSRGASSRGGGRSWRSGRGCCFLVRLLEELPDLFEREVLKRLDPVDRTMLAQVGRPWRTAVLAAAGGGDGSLGSRRCWLPRLPKGVTVRLRLREFCTSADRLAWAKANGSHWGGPPSLTRMSRVIKSKGVATPEQVAAYEAAGRVVQLGIPEYRYGSSLAGSELFPTLAVGHI